MYFFYTFHLLARFLVYSTVISEKQSNQTQEFSSAFVLNACVIKTFISVIVLLNLSYNLSCALYSSLTCGLFLGFHRTPPGWPSG